jgi:predicted nucleotidyltransferase
MEEQQVTRVMTDDLIQLMIEKVVYETHPELVYVFGSYARGEAREESDLDLLIIEKMDFGPENNRWSEMKKIRRALSGFHIAKDILVFSMSEYDYWKEASNHIVAQAAKDGRLVYARS